jgi:hypothetical protein
VRLKFRRCHALYGPGRFICSRDALSKDGDDPVKSLHCGDPDLIQTHASQVPDCQGQSTCKCLIIHGQNNCKYLIRSSIISQKVGLSSLSPFFVGSGFKSGSGRQKVTVPVVPVPHSPTGFLKVFLEAVLKRVDFNCSN